MAAPPTGTVTFLFTDIEGSTTRWEHQRSAMQQALARHDSLLRQAIEAHGGYVFKTVGDAFYAAFTRPPDALAAAIAAQHTLRSTDWGEVGSLRARMALHTGVADERDGDYFGPRLNRVARLLSAGHGGQVLLSRATQELVRDDLPPDIALCDLGVHRLKDLIRPEHVFQLVAPGILSDFPPLRTLDYLPNNLPLQRAPFIGRERELQSVKELVQRSDVGLVSLTGAGGTGKTRLALQVAADLLDTFSDGAWFVNLAPLTDPALVMSTVAQILGLAETGRQPLIETLKAYVQDKHLLLVLDNFEQVVPAANQIAELLAAGPLVKVLVTTRAPLRLYNEHEYPVPPLALPDPKRLPPLDRLTQYEAVRLFIQRAQAVKPDFQITNANAPAVAEICVRLDGLPLAIELAAARSKLLTPQAMSQRLGNRLTLLTGGARDLPARQQTLRAAIDWSYSLLDASEQTLFNRLAVFVGGATIEAIETVCNAEGDLSVDPLDGIASLLDKSLLRQEEGPQGEPRFVMLETIHEYAEERLEVSGERVSLCQRHVAYYLALAETAVLELQGPRLVTWLDRLEQEHDNFRAALKWACAANESASGLRLAAALHRFWLIRSHISEGRQWLGTVLNQSGGSTTRARAAALNGAGVLASVQGATGQAIALLDESLALWRQLGDKVEEAMVLSDRGTVAVDVDNYAQASQFFEESIALFRAAGNNAGVMAPVTNLGYLALSQHDYGRAKPLLEEGLALSREAGDTWGVAVSLINLATLILEQHNYGHAETLLKECLALAQELSDKVTIAECLTEIAGVAAGQDDAHRAARLWGAAQALYAATAYTPPDNQQAMYDRHVSPARAHLDVAAWTIAAEEGGRMTLEQAITYALEETGTNPTAPN